ncbi:MAG: hypothetical protein K1X57_06255 [Gemmataceae bacterium]|nr:hypothetical protein [Gemmataceae bacterium]
MSKRGLSNLQMRQMYECFKPSVMYKGDLKSPWKERAKIHKARAKLVLGNLFTGGLINIYYKFLIVPNSAKEKNVRKMKNQEKLLQTIGAFSEFVARKGDTGLTQLELQGWLKHVFGLADVPDVSQEFEQGWDRFLQNPAYVEKLGGLAREFPFAI